MALLGAHEIRGYEDQETHPEAVQIPIFFQWISFNCFPLRELLYNPSSPAFRGLHTGLIALLCF